MSKKQKAKIFVLVLLAALLVISLIGNYLFIAQELAEHKAEQTKLQNLSICQNCGHYRHLEKQAAALGLFDKDPYMYEKEADFGIAICTYCHDKAIVITTETYYKLIELRRQEEQNNKR